ncbi:hypothetical protein PTKIN_Ptkin13bG0001000 [Pterospermum kingtungense]
MDDIDIEEFDNPSLTQQLNPDRGTEVQPLIVDVHAYDDQEIVPKVEEARPTAVKWQRKPPRPRSMV